MTTYRTFTNKEIKMLFYFVVKLISGFKAYLAFFRSMRFTEERCVVYLYGAGISYMVFNEGWENLFQYPSDFVIFYLFWPMSLYIISRDHILFFGKKKFPE